MEPRQLDPVTPQLHALESLMEQALSEACATTSASKVDTGELIRVEEMLEIAADAAKQAIALRRQRREGSTRSSTSGAPAMGSAEAVASEGVTHRAFTDERGVTWDVYAVYPEARLSPKLRGTFQHGWLCFDAGPEKRRLSPIPDKWQELAADELNRLADRAERARPRRGGKSSGDDEPARTESRPPSAQQETRGERS